MHCCHNGDGDPFLCIVMPEHEGIPEVYEFIFVRRGYPVAQDLPSGKHVRAEQQSQSIAYSLDEGETWTNGDPFLCIVMPEHEGIPEVYEFIFVRRGRVVNYGDLPSGKHVRAEQQSQSIAYSLDEGETWTTYDAETISVYRHARTRRDPGSL
jgi:sucrose-6-phosphate hydrolase SacC (GH32 family)